MRVLRRRLMVSQYEKLNYIGNQNKGYIDTGIIPNEKTAFEAGYGNIRGNIDQTKFPFGSIDSWNITKITNGYMYSWGYNPKGCHRIVFGNGEDKSKQPVNGNYETLPFVVGNTDYFVSFNKPKLEVWENRKKYADLSSDVVLTNKNNFTVYHNKSYFYDDFADFNLYYLRIYEEYGSKLIRDFIPVRRRSDGKIGLLDRVENKFYLSPNGAEFTGG